MRTKKILIVSNANFYGGGEQFVFSILSTIENAFFIVNNDLLYSKLPPEKVIRFTSDNWYTQLKEILCTIKEKDIDITILNGGSAIYFAPFLKKQKIIIYRHTTNSCVRSILKRFLYIIILHFCYFFAKKIIHVSNYSRNEQKLFKRKAITIYNGTVDIAEKKEKRDPLNLPLKLLFLGRVTETKGIIEIIDAISSFSKDNLILKVVGTGELLESLKEKYKDSKQILFYGFRNEVDLFYQDCDLFISFSHSENCPLTIIDAMKWELPVIAKPVGGVPEMVLNGKNGFIVSNIEEMKTALEKVLKQADLIESMGKYSRNLYEEKFTSIETLSLITEILNDI